MRNLVPRERHDAPEAEQRWGAGTPGRTLPRQRYGVRGGPFAVLMACARASMSGPTNNE